jgi:hypothetical protein
MNTNIPEDRDDTALWKMFAEDAVPIITQKFGISESEALKMWFDHQPEIPKIIDVMYLETDEEREAFDKRVRDSTIMTYLFQPGRKRDASDSEDQRE